MAVIPEQEEENGQARAVILAPRRFNMTRLDNLCNKDCAVAQLSTQQGTMIVASIYLDINLTPSPDWLDTLVWYADNKGCRLVIGVDSNAHSQLYGPDTNRRSEVFEEVILAHGLYVENIGIAPTFEVCRNDRHIQTHIDVTLTKGDVTVHDWQVHRGYNGSDHNTITWAVDDRVPEAEPTRNWKKAKWDLFTQSLTN